MRSLASRMAVTNNNSNNMKADTKILPLLYRAQTNIMAKFEMLPEATDNVAQRLVSHMGGTA